MAPFDSPGRRARLPRQLGIALAAWLLLSGCGSAVTSAPPSVTMRPSPTAAPTGGSRPSQASAPTPQASPSPPAGQPDVYGPTATVTTGGLRVRSWPGIVGGNVMTELDAGETLVLDEGPLSLDGYDWFHVRFEPRTSGDFAGLDQGWVASGPTDDPSRFLRRGETRCPSKVDLTALAGLQPLAFASCGVVLSEVSGIVETCFEGPITPFAYEPGWAWFSCLSVRSIESDVASGGLMFHLPPDFDGPRLERGDVVRLTGEQGFDTERYGPCTVQTIGSEEAADVLEAARLIWAMECPYRYVVSDVEVIDHVDLPPLY